MLTENLHLSMLLVGVKLVDTDFTIKEEKVINNFKNFKDNKNRKEK